MVNMLARSAFNAGLQRFETECVDILEGHAASYELPYYIDDRDSLSDLCKL